MIGMNRSTGLALLVVGAALVTGCARNEQTLAPATTTAQRLSTRQCPDMQIRAGGEARVVYDRAGETDPSRVRYQAAILEISRACFTTNGAITADFGVAGRIIAGPRGTGGTASAPLRVTLVANGTEVLFSRVYTVSANIAAPAYGGDYTVTDTIALPATAAPGTLIIFVGFDQN